jgi:hypothetical protein
MDLRSFFFAENSDIKGGFFSDDTYLILEFSHTGGFEVDYYYDTHAWSD